MGMHKYMVESAVLVWPEACGPVGLSQDMQGWGKLYRYLHLGLECHIALENCTSLIPSADDRLRRTGYIPDDLPRLGSIIAGWF